LVDCRNLTPEFRLSVFNYGRFSGSPLLLLPSHPPAGGQWPKLQQNLQGLQLRAQPPGFTEFPFKIIPVRKSSPSAAKVEKVSLGKVN